LEYCFENKILAEDEVDAEIEKKYGLFSEINHDHMQP